MTLQPATTIVAVLGCVLALAGVAVGDVCSDPLLDACAYSPVIELPANNISTALPVQFIANVPSNPCITVQWNFSDGATATGASVTHTFALAGFPHSSTHWANVTMSNDNSSVTMIARASTFAMRPNIIQADTLAANWSVGWITDCSHNASCTPFSSVSFSMTQTNPAAPVPTVGQLIAGVVDETWLPTNAGTNTTAMNLEIVNVVALGGGLHRVDAKDIRFWEALAFADIDMSCVQVDSEAVNTAAVRQHLASHETESALVHRGFDPQATSCSTGVTFGNPVKVTAGCSYTHSNPDVTLSVSASVSTGLRIRIDLYWYGGLEELSVRATFVASATASATLSIPLTWSTSVNLFEKSFGTKVMMLGYVPFVYEPYAKGDVALTFSLGDGEFVASIARTISYTTVVTYDYNRVPSYTATKTYDPGEWTLSYTDVPCSATLTITPSITGGLKLYFLVALEVKAGIKMAANVALPQEGCDDCNAGVKTTLTLVISATGRELVASNAVTFNLLNLPFADALYCFEGTPQLIKQLCCDTPEPTPEPPTPEPTPVPPTPVPPTPVPPPTPEPPTPPPTPTPYVSPCDERNALCDAVAEICAPMADPSDARTHCDAVVALCMRVVGECNDDACTPTASLTPDTPAPPGGGDPPGAPVGTPTPGTPASDIPAPGTPGGGGAHGSTSATPTQTGTQGP